MSNRLTKPTFVSRDTGDGLVFDIVERLDLGLITNKVRDKITSIWGRIPITKLAIFFMIISLSISALFITATPLVKEYSAFKKMQLTTLPPTAELAQKEMIRTLQDCRGLPAETFTMKVDPDGAITTTSIASCSDDYRWKDPKYGKY